MYSFQKKLAWNSIIYSLFTLALVLAILTFVLLLFSVQKNINLGCFSVIPTPNYVSNESYFPEGEIKTRTRCIKFLLSLLQDS